SDLDGVRGVDTQIQIFSKLLKFYWVEIGLNQFFKNQIGCAENSVFQFNKKIFFINCRRRITKKYREEKELIFFKIGKFYGYLKKLENNCSRENNITNLKNTGFLHETHRLPNTRYVKLPSF